MITFLLLLIIGEKSRRLITSLGWHLTFAAAEVSRVDCVSQQLIGILMTAYFELTMQSSGESELAEDPGSLAI